MAEIIITPLAAADRERWGGLWRGYLDFYETRLPPEIYDDTWRRLLAAAGPIYGLGARIGSDTAALVGIVHYLFHAHAWTPTPWSLPRSAKLSCKPMPRRRIRPGGMLPISSGRAGQNSPR